MNTFQNPQRTESYSAIENNELLIYTIQKNLRGFMKKKNNKNTCCVTSHLC